MMKVLIVEDSPVYVALLKNKLAETNLALDVVGNAANIKDARRLIDEHQPDVLILDIDLETETIFELFHYIDYKKYEIIFATAFDKYAVSAFDVEAIGYLVKPVIAAQLEKFLLIAQDNIGIKSEQLINETIAIKSQKQIISNTTISVPSEIGFDVIAISKIHRCEAINAGTHIFMEDGKKLVSSYNLGKFSEILADKGFFQVHRSHVINLSFVKQYLRSGIIVMMDNAEIPLSKPNRQSFIGIFSTTEKPA